MEIENEVDPIAFDHAPTGLTLLVKDGKCAFPTGKLNADGEEVILTVTVGREVAQVDYYGTFARPTYMAEDATIFALAELARDHGLRTTHPCLLSADPFHSVPMCKECTAPLREWRPLYHEHELPGKLD